MKKRIVCALLTLILLLGLVPATALTASAASLKTSEAAITVLKQLEGFSGKCDVNGYIGYHTKCTKKGAHGDTAKPHTIGQSAADEALRAELANLDKAINSFASGNGLSLSQNKHDALVLFSFQNGTSWVNGAGDFRAAVVNGKKGDDFLNAILSWNEKSGSRRKVEANMYLNGIYSITAPTNYIFVNYDANGGDLNGAKNRGYYYDVSANPQPHMVPTRKDFTFTGWYYENKLVTSLTTALNGQTLTARWMDNKNSPDSAEDTVDYKVALTQLVSQDVYKHELDDGKYTFSLDKDAKGNVIKAKTYATDGYLTITKEYIDKNGTKWGIIKSVSKWVKLPGSTTASTTTTESNAIDVTVKVTNSYLNRRADASIYAAKNGSYDLGTSLRIIDTASSDGFLWGKVAQNTTGSESVGWVALMYTDYDTVRNQSNSFTTGSIIATGFITYNGYVNVRSNAGTVNPIVGSLYKGTQVNIYETKYVNGLEWGRTDTGWFCMSYANVTRLAKEKDNSTDINYISYVFTGTTKWDSSVFDAPNGNELAEKVKGGTAVTVTAFAEGTDGNTWGKISQGWIRVNTNEGAVVDVILDPAKFTVVNEVTVRDVAGNNSERVNTLSKNVSFQVNSAKQVVVTGENLWGYATVLDSKTSGWINLSNKYVTRDDAPNAGKVDTTTGKIATIVGADSVRVRGDSTLSGKVIGSINQGTQVNILGERNGWYKIDYKCTDEEGVDSWVYGQYVQVSEGTVGSGTTGTATAGTGVGIIANTYGGVNLRATPGTAGTLKGKILPGTQVNILETRTVGTAKWGRVENGWICMDYVQIISDLPADVLAALGVGNTGSASGSTTTGAEVAMYTGKVDKDNIIVYAEPDKSSAEIRRLNTGANVTIHEIRTVVTSENGTTTTPDSDGSTTTTVMKTTTYWARVNDGYIINPETNLVLDALDEAVYTVTESDTLNVRDAAGTGGNKVFKLLKGDQVKVTKVKIIDGSVWGNVECDEGTGWASLAYMTKGAVATNTGNTNTGTTGTAGTTTGTTGTVTGSTGNTGKVSASGYLYTGKVINTDSVRVRNTASTTASVSTNLKQGASLVIYETVISEGMAWGRCDAGWVYLYYVDMTPVNGSGAVDARVVYNDNTMIYADKDGSSTVGTYAKMAVIDIYEIVGKMARTDLGWVSTDNLL